MLLFQYKPNDDDTFNVNIDDIKAQPDDDLQALINGTDELVCNLILTLRYDDEICPVELVP